MSPEKEVADWWNSLSVEQRKKEALNLQGHNEGWDPWDGRWSELIPISQQMELHMYYDGMIKGKKPLYDNRTAKDSG